MLNLKVELFQQKYGNKKNKNKSKGWNKFSALDFQNKVLQPTQTAKNQKVYNIEYKIHTLNNLRIMMKEISSSV